VYDLRRVELTPLSETLNVDVASRIAHSYKFIVVVVVGVVVVIEASIIMSCHRNSFVNGPTFFRWPVDFHASRLYVLDIGLVTHDEIFHFEII